MMVLLTLEKLAFVFCDLYETRSAYYHGSICYFTIDMPIFEHIGNHDRCTEIESVVIHTHSLAAKFPGRGLAS